MNKRTNIGKLIKEEMEKQGMKAADLAKKLCFERTAVYKLFNKTSIDTALLGRISKVLDRNFFRDIANDMSLSGVNDKEAIRDIEDRMAVSQFMEVVPQVLLDMGKHAAIFIEKNQLNIPSFCIGEYSPIIMFTIGCNLYDLPHIKKAIPRERVVCYTKEKEGIDAYLIDSHTIHCPGILDIKLDYKTKEEWKDILQFVFDNIIKGKNQVVQKSDIIWYK